MIEDTTSSNENVKLNVFDLDGTLLNSNCSFAFSFYLYKKGLFSFFDELYCLCVALSYKYLGLSLETLHKNVFNKLFFKKSIHRFEDEALLFVPDFIPKAVNPLVLNKIQEAKANGEKILLLSSSPNFLVKPISNYFKIPFQSTQYRFNKLGNLEDISLLMSGKKKAEIIKSIIQKDHIKKHNITAYSDHIDDLPLLESVGKAVAVKPCFKLKKIAKSRNWEIID